MLRLHPAIPRFCVPAQVVFGPGSIAALRSVTAARVAVVSRRESLFAMVAKNIAAPSVEWIQPSWSGEPRLGDLTRSLAAVEDFGPDWIVAVGGGSVIDGAKLLWARYEHPGVPFEVRGGIVGIGRLRTKSRFAAVPTTAGSGSEMSSAALFTDAETGRKIPCVSPELIPDIAVLDARLMADVPGHVLGPSALDAFAHAVEGSVSRFPNEFADSLAAGAARVIHGSLVGAMDGTEREAHRSRLLVASSHAGAVQNHRVPGAAHAIAHQLSVFGIPHGIATGLLLPHVIRHNMRDAGCAIAFGRFAQLSGLGNAAEDLCRTAGELVYIAGVAPSFSSLSPKPNAEGLARIIDGAHADVCMKANPVPMTSEEIGHILELAWA